MLLEPCRWCSGQKLNFVVGVPDLNAGDDGDNDEPEPEEDVDLLVDDVERQHAERVKLLDGTRGTELVELALGHLHNILRLTFSPTITDSSTQYN